MYFVRSAKKQKERVWYDFGTDYRQPDMVENVVNKAKDAVSGNRDDHKEQ